MIRRALRQLFRAGALEYDVPGTAPGPEHARGPVDVIVPVYGAAADLARCLRSVSRHGPKAPHRLVVVVDGAGQADVEAVLETEGEGAVVLRHAERRGFAASVHTALRSSDRDVVLLNSDTVVTARWIEKLQEAAYSARAIATVTPFSNDATLCSLPRAFESNAIPAGQDVDSMGALVELSSARQYPRLPTGAGFCLYVKRAALEAVGGLSSPDFGLGYGEEVEFCLRARKAGWVHVLDDATFVYHAGQRSFGPARDARVRRAERTMSRLHPEYRATIARFMQRNDLAPVRARVLAHLTPPRVRGSTGPSRVLHVVHGWPSVHPAGTEGYARALAVHQARARDVVVLARLADACRAEGDAIELLDHGVRVRLFVNNFTQRNPLARNALWNRQAQAEFERLLETFRPELVHLHHLSGHSGHLPRVLGPSRIPYVYQVQDWWTACARANLLRPDRTLCAGPELRKCSSCLPLTRRPGASAWNPLLYAFRSRLLRSGVHRAAAVVVGSRFIAESLREWGVLGASQPCHVVPYGIPLPQESVARDPRSPLRFAVIGSILPHKGVHVAVQAFRGIDPAQAALCVWGDADTLPAYAAELRAAASPAVRFGGVFPEEQREAVFAQTDVLIAPSLGLESFGLALREAMARGVPVLASRRGAFLEAFEDGTQGAFFEAGDVAALRAHVDRLAADPSIVASWSSGLPRVKGLDEHAAEIEAVYEEVLRGRAP